MQLYIYMQNTIHEKCLYVEKSINQITKKIILNSIDKKVKCSHSTQFYIKCFKMQLFLFLICKYIYIYNT